MQGKIPVDAETSELIARLIARIVHDFNNPLAAILGFADLLRNPSLPQEKRERYVSRVYEQALKLSQLVETMAWFSTIPAPQVESFDLVRAVSDVFALREGGFQAAGISLEKRVPGGAVRVTGDRAVTARILNALLNNVEQTFRENPCQIRRAVLECGVDDGSPFVEVADSGAGVSPDDDQAIFEPFFSTRKSGGLGLGLTVARSLARRQGGDVVLRRPEKPEPAGAHFRLTLPAEQG